MKFEKGNSKVILGIGIVLLLVILGILIYMLSVQPKQAPATQQDSKIASIPPEIKTLQEASSLQKDTADIVNEIDDTLGNIEDSLPDV